MKKFISLLILTIIFYSVVPHAINYKQDKSISNGTKPISASAVTNVDETAVIEPLTFEEVASGYPRTSNVSCDEAFEAIPSSLNKPKDYRALSVILDVTDTYKPTLEFHCYIDTCSQYWGITSIYSVKVNCRDGDIYKHFNGNIGVWLRSPYQIEYVINGDFYNNGNATVGSNNLDIGIDDSADLNFGVSFKDRPNHYGYCFQHEFHDFQ